MADIRLRGPPCLATYGEHEKGVSRAQTPLMRHHGIHLQRRTMVWSHCHCETNLFVVNILRRTICCELSARNRYSLWRKRHELWRKRYCEAIRLALLRLLLRAVNLRAFQSRMESGFSAYNMQIYYCTSFEALSAMVTLSGAHRQ
jgi:hypothetical protein